MLKKLFRYEFGNTWMLPVLFNLIAVALTLVTGYQFRLLKPYMQTSEVPVALRVNQTISGFLLMALILFMVASNLILVLYFYVRFYKEIYSDVGYLMHTLPVTKRELLTAHTLVGGFWALEYGIMDIFCTTWMFIMVSKFSISFEEALYQLRRALEMQQWDASIWGRGIFILLLTLVLLLISPFLQMAKGFCAISLGQIFKSHRVFGNVYCDQHCAGAGTESHHLLRDRSGGDYLGFCRKWRARNFTVWNSGEVPGRLDDGGALCSGEFPDPPTAALSGFLYFAVCDFRNHQQKSHGKQFESGVMGIKWRIW